MDASRFYAPSPRDIAVTVGAIALQIAIFVINIMAPVSYAVWIFHAWPLVLSLFQRDHRLPYLCAGLATIFTVLAVPLSGEIVPNLQVVVFNRAAGSLSFIVMGAMVGQILVRREIARRAMWLQQTESTLAQRLAGDLSVNEVGQITCEVLCEQMSAQLAVVYCREGEVLSQVAGYALHTTEPAQTVALGEGLLGQACLDGKYRVLSPAPAGHLPLRTALGQSAPAHVLVLPLNAEGRLVGAMEIGIMRPNVDFTQLGELARQTSEVVGMALRGALYRRERQLLLERTLHQAEELQAQQEKLRITNEELEEQSSALQESQATLVSQQTELERANAQLGSYAQSLEQRQQELLKSRETLKANAVALEAVSRYKSEFLANTSHELRTPLNSSLILSRLLMENKDGRLSSEEVRFATAIYQSNNDLLMLINDILDLSKIEAGHADLYPESVNLVELVQRLESVFQPQARQKNLQLLMEVDPQAPTQIITDGQRLQQILKNLLSNAIKFTAQGRVSLRVQGTKGGGVRIDVIDTGLGIPADKQELIFEAFRQADGSTSRLFGGTGLGLSISLQLARRMGGTLAVVSAPGQGSTFTVELPAELPPGVATPGQRIGGAEAPQSPGISCQKVEDVAGSNPVALRPYPTLSGDRPVLMVVGGDDSFAQTLKELIEDRGFDCVLARTGAEALRFAREIVPSGVLLDIGLPDTADLSVLERLGRDAETRHIPVFTVSPSERSLTALEKGAAGHLRKPASREQIGEAIERIEAFAEKPLRRVLVVEADQRLRKSVEDLRTIPGAEITTEGTVAGALALLGRTHFDCMVTDLTLPDDDGFSLLEKMSADPRDNFPPVIVYIGRVLTQEEETRLHQYSLSIIVKGVRSPERLLDEVTLFLHSAEEALPRVQQRMLQRARRRDPVLDGRCILLAEDDVCNIFALSSVFEPLGVQLEIARNGREAVERMSRAPHIDLILMDVMMPEMDGLAAIHLLRADEATATIPIIALTAKAMSEDRQSCLDAGANDYLAKPVDIDHLISLCRVWMNGPGYLNEDA